MRNNPMQDESSRRSVWLTPLLFSGTLILAISALITVCEFLPCRIGSDLDLKVDTAERWEKDFAQALPTGAGRLQPHWYNSDIAAAIFSYSAPRGLSPSQVFSQLRTQLPEFRVELESTEELVLRHPVHYFSRNAFDEWRFLYSKAHSIITALWANLDTPSELRCHELLIKTLHEFHSKRISQKS